MSMLSEPPVRLCCGLRHWGVLCPDGLVMCCICWERIPADECYIDDEDTRWDMCRTCGPQAWRGCDGTEKPAKA